MKKVTVKISFHHLVILLIVCLVIFLLFRSNKNFIFVTELPVEYFDNETQTTNIHYVRVYKTTKKMTYDQMFGRLPRNRFLSFFGLIPSRKEIYGRYFFEQYPEYHRFLSFHVVDGTLFRQAAVTEYFFQERELQTNTFLVSSIFPQHRHPQKAGKLVVIGHRSRKVIK